ncbi:WD40 repeat domain-containing protein [Actinomadura sp. CNU-125]|uniref:WD40 repeat domain-containing protein n=1 Tax=Actinomadura sp. CNU-125 TaxID=1904961 RepID=UPI0021CCFF5B|nr:hypothetical protein [Actinomadura sp. CNU-125]
MRGGDLSALPDEVLGTVTTAHLADGAGPDDRRGLRRLGKARAVGPRSLADGAGAVPVPVTSWDVRWSALRRHTPHLTLAGHGGRVQAAASLRGADGARLLATGDEDGKVRIWDPLTGHAVAPAIGGDGRILTMTFVEAGDGTRTLVTTHESRSRGSMRLLNLETDEVHRAGTPEWYVSSAVLTDADGAVHLAVGTNRGRIRLLDPLTGEPSGDPLTGHIGHVTALAALPPAQGRTRLVSAGDDGTMRIWDPLGGGGTRWTRKRNAGLGPLGAVAVVDGALLVTAGTDERLLVWDVDGNLDAEGPRPLPTPVPGGVRALAAVGRSTVAAASAKGVVHLLGVGERAGEATVLTGHHGPVDALAEFGTDGGARLASCGEDRTVKVWNPDAAGPSVRSAGAGRVRAVDALPGGVLAVLDEDDGVSFRRGADGEPAAPPHPPDGPVGALAAFTGASGRALLAVEPRRTARPSRHGRYVYGLDPLTGERTNLFDADRAGSAGPGVYSELLTAFSGCAGEAGTLVTGWHTGPVRTFDAASGTWRRIGVAPGHGNVRAVAAFARRARACGGDGR